MEILDYLIQRKREIIKMLAIDKRINADPYDDVARLREVEAVEKIIKEKR